MEKLHGTRTRSKVISTNFFLFYPLPWIEEIKKKKKWTNIYKQDYAEGKKMCAEIIFRNVKAYFSWESEKKVTLEGHKQWASIYIWGTLCQVYRCWGNWIQWRDSLNHCKVGKTRPQPNSPEKNHRQPMTMAVKEKKEVEEEGENTTVPFQILWNLIN